ncbi:thioesterase II family protein [Hymenobacter sp. B81]|uniref:thioesterase II family protein n=1 Tax=Hymenobacter sp. B81 TaxID=3344878 RepID=UPI0037DD34CF
MQKIQLFSIPYAGGGKYSFCGLKPFLSPEIEHVALELPGRGQRVTETLLTDLGEMVEDLYQQLLAKVAGPYLLYGHSMGGILGNELLRRMQVSGMELPLHFFATGCAAPAAERYRRGRHRLSDGLLTHELTKLGGLPAEVLASDELMSFCLPIIRADIRALETHRYPGPAASPVPLTVIVGRAEGLSEEDVADWAAETRGGFRALRLPGNHFFIHQQYPVIAALMKEAVALEIAC